MPLPGAAIDENVGSVHVSSDTLGVIWIRGQPGDSAQVQHSLHRWLRVGQVDPELVVKLLELGFVVSHVLIRVCCIPLAGQLAAFIHRHILPRAGDVVGQWIACTVVPARFQGQLVKRRSVAFPLFHFLPVTRQGFRERFSLAEVFNLKLMPLKPGERFLIEPANLFLLIR